MRIPAAAVIAITMVGCQCIPLTEHYCDVIDEINDHECCGERLYYAPLDLQRIGKADWCKCRLNRWLCPSCCRRACYIEAHRDYSKEYGHIWSAPTIKSSTPAPPPAPNADPNSMYDEPERLDSLPPAPAEEELDTTPPPPPPLPALDGLDAD